MYWDDKYNTQGISNEVCTFSFGPSVFQILSCVIFFENVMILQVVSAMREMVNKDTQNLASNSFLLDDDLR